MMEKYKMAGRYLYMSFVNLEKVFDCVKRDVIWWALRKKGCNIKRSFCHYGNELNYKNICKN